MMHLRVVPLGEKQLRIRGIDLLLASILQELPQILEHRDAPAAHERLFPNPTANDEKTNADWQQLVGPDLRHLFVAAGETVARDLTALEPEPLTEGRVQVTFPAEHLNAWMNALNQARLILAEQFHLDEAALNAESFDLKEAESRAVLKVHLLGYLLHLLVELGGAQ
jgi:hypothetical protein